LLCDFVFLSVQFTSRRRQDAVASGSYRRDGCIL
jgi:hypothetical protein